MTILHISDTHNLHHKIISPLISKADILIHSGDITNNGTEQEVLDSLNWFISLPDAHKIFVTGNHDTCLLDAEKIDDLPENVHFLQDSSVSIGGTTFFGLGYSHNEMLIPGGIDFLITHEPPISHQGYTGVTSRFATEFRKLSLNTICLGMHMKVMA